MSAPDIMNSVLVTVVCVCLCLQTVLCQYQDTCTTLEGGIGTCTPAVSCAAYFDLQRQAKRLDTSFQLRDTQCKSNEYDVMICCPNERQRETTLPFWDFDSEYNCGEDQRNAELVFTEETCTTIEGGIGKCESLAACEPYSDLTRQAKHVPLTIQLRDAQCGSHGNEQKVCCPTSVSSSSTTEQASFRVIAESDYITDLPEPPECGLGLSFFVRVVGGAKAALGYFPWMALLGTKQENWDTARWICGGSLISHHHVLTAAHCIKNELNVVRLGELDFGRDNDSASPIDLSIKRKIKHENFDYSSFTNDIGLLILEKDVEFSETFSELIRPICLPRTGDVNWKSLVGFNQFLAGWGNIDNRGASSSHLRYVELPVVNNSVCEKAYESRVIDERVMCVGSYLKDSCSGDSGGPLMDTIRNSTTFRLHFYQTAVVSYGYTKCGEENFPGVYSSLEYFLPWIKERVLGFVE
ncbi:unnamed protein product [Danaus chrysippus]|uniref:CLIP domain-containing serine protease n=1 Tax=Danaus chrysippus TaxID=151541 RepID=A0A8J2QTM3_9NEOP|nr:unnamed protein product [Danaus chrysippus]